MDAVIATDLSEAMDAAIGSRTCLECLRRYGIDRIHLVTVTSPNVHSGVLGGGISDRGRRALEGQRRLLEEEGFDVEAQVVRGTPHRRINGLADRVDAGLVIVGSRGRSPLENRLIGSTVRNVARTTVRPLLVQRIADDGGDPEVVAEHLFERVLYATDFSENAEHAFEQFDRLQGATKEALLVHVAAPEHRAESDEGVADPEARLEELADDLRGRGIDASVAVREGDAVEEILAAEAAYDPTVVLMGARGRSPIRRLLMGSVSESVVARSDSNVLVVPPSRLR